MKKLMAEFREFIDKGDIVDAAVGLILALAFVPVVGSLVDDILMPIIAAIFGQPDFQALYIDIGDARIMYGNFITVVISFLLIAFAVFMMVKAYNRFKAEKPAEESGPSEVDLLIEIRDSLGRG